MMILISHLNASEDPDLPYEADNNGFIEEINVQINFENKLFESTYASECAIQSQEGINGKVLKNLQLLAAISFSISAVAHSQVNLIKKRWSKELSEIILY